MINRFTDNLKNVLKQAEHNARLAKRRVVTLMDLTKALDALPGSLGTEMLKTTKTPGPRNNKSTLPTIVKKQTKKLKPLTLNSDVKDVLLRAVVSAQQNKNPYVGTEHLLYSLLQLPPEKLEGLPRQFILAVDKLKPYVRKLLQGTAAFYEMTEGYRVAREEICDAEHPHSALNTFAVNLVDKAAQSNIDPVIGGERELDRLINILSRRNKNNPLLIGEAGVGKTALVEGLAKKILLGEVPDVLKHKKIYALEMSSLVAGTMYRGEFEERLKQLIEEVKQNANLILFIDELHTIVGAGSASGSLDAANILKPALARGQIRCIGATTVNEYRKHLENDAALKRRFQTIYLESPDSETAKNILRGLKPYYEQYHRVLIKEEAIKAAVDLSLRYLPEQQLPDKAIDLIDEAASVIKVRQLKDDVTPILKNCRNRLQKTLELKDKAIKHSMWKEAKELQVIEKELLQMLEECATSQAKLNKIPVGEIGELEIASVVSKMTGVPTGLLADEKTQLLALEKLLKKQLLGQDEALEKVATTIRRARAGLSAPTRPWGSFLFLGPTGVGKTELAKILAREIFGRADTLVRLDMSEFNEKLSLSKLIGSPAGYVGYKESGLLSEAVKRRPYCLVLLDEIEKAHADVFNLLLQVLDDGFLTDGSGKRVDFTNTIIIMTSNLGSQELLKPGIGFGETAQIKAFDQTLTKAAKDLFSPEFLNRLDQLVVFKPLDKKSMGQIINLQLQPLIDRLAVKNWLLKLNKEAKNWLVEKAWDPLNGARPLRRLLQTELEAPLANLLLSPEAPDKATVTVSVKDDKLTFELK